MKRVLSLLGLMSLLLATLAGCATPSTSPKTVADVAAADSRLSTLTRLIREAELTDTLRAAGPYTVFAPTNEAFEALPAAELQALAADRARLKAVLSYHVLPGRTLAAEVNNGSVKTVQGSNLSLSRAGTFVTVEEAMVMQADVPAANGVVHLIDRVLMPPKK